MDLSIPRSARTLVAGVALTLLLAGSSAAQESRFLRHILVKNEQIADAILARLQSGKDFKELARKYSLDVGTRPLGGDLDWTLPQNLEPEFARQAWAIAEKGGFAKAQTRHGWHVIQYVDSRPAPEAKPIPPPKPAPAPGESGASSVPAANEPPNEDLKFHLIWPRTSFAPGESIEFGIEAKNNTDKPLEIFTPELWPLGLIIRYQFGKMNQALELPPEWAASELAHQKVTLAPGESLRKDYSLQDYFGARESWPIIRVIWRGDTLFGRLEKSVPRVMEAEDYPVRKGRWRYYISEESRITILPEYKPDDRWFLCVYSRGRTWVEIRDPGIPGLIERFLDGVRSELYSNTVISQYSPGDFFAAVLPRRRGEIPHAAPETAIAWEAGTVGLALDVSGRDPVVADSLCFALDTPTSITQGAIPFGRVVHTEGDPIKRTIEALEMSQGVQISLLLAYPEALAPPEVRAAAAALPPPRHIGEKVDFSPESGWKPVVHEGARQFTKPERARPEEKVPPISEIGPHEKEATPAVANDLPRIEFATSKGRMVVELFEDDAPNTVANFVKLAESGFFDGDTIVRRESNPSNRGFVQSGSPDNTATGAPDFTIPDEPNARRHLRGALAMARKHSVPDSAGSQFYICLDEQPQLDGTYTVFGQVFLGLEVADLLQVGDVIQTAKVIRKRDHEYVPRTIPRVKP